ncbi:unnamed protein product [Sympodiomycopsis kandeliae]
MPAEILSVDLPRRLLHQRDLELIEERRREANGQEDLALRRAWSEQTAKRQPKQLQQQRGQRPDSCDLGIRDCPPPKKNHPKRGQDRVDRQHHRDGPSRKRAPEHQHGKNSGYDEGKGPPPKGKGHHQRGQKGQLDGEGDPPGNSHDPPGHPYPRGQEVQLDGDDPNDPNHPHHRRGREVQLDGEEPNHPHYPRGQEVQLDGEKPNHPHYSRGRENQLEGEGDPPHDPHDPHDPHHPPKPRGQENQLNGEDPNDPNHPHHRRGQAIDHDDTVPYPVKRDDAQDVAFGKGGCTNPPCPHGRRSLAEPKERGTDDDEDGKPHPHHPRAKRDAQDEEACTAPPCPHGRRSLAERQERGTDVKDDDHSDNPKPHYPRGNVDAKESDGKPRPHHPRGKQGPQDDAFSHKYRFGMFPRECTEPDCGNHVGQSLPHHKERGTDTEDDKGFPVGGGGGSHHPKRNEDPECPPEDPNCSPGHGKRVDDAMASGGDKVEVS